ECIVDRDDIARGRISRGDCLKAPVPCARRRLPRTLWHPPAGALHEAAFGGSTMSLRDTYAYAIQTAKGKFDGSAQEKDGKLHFVGSVKTEDEKNEIWTAIKTIPTWQNDIVADIKVTGGGAAAPAAAPAAAKTYT